jgi:hypothetical protein
LGVDDQLSATRQRRPIGRVDLLALAIIEE